MTARKPDNLTQSPHTTHSTLTQKHNAKLLDSALYIL